MSTELSSLDRKLLLEAKLIEKPAIFDGCESSWLPWKTKLLNWLAVVEPRMVELMEIVGRPDGRIDSDSDETKKLGVVLYVILTSLFEGRLLQIVQAVEQRAGFEVWKQVLREMEPKLAHRRLAAIESLLDPDFGGEDGGLYDRILAWEAQVRGYAELTGKTLDSELRAAVLVKRMPVELRQHLQLNAGAFMDDYTKLRDVALSYLKLRTPPTVSHTGPRPMEVDFIKGKGRFSKGMQSFERPRKGDKGKGYGGGGRSIGSSGEEHVNKGKGKARSDPCVNASKGKDRKSVCWCCGGKGHFARDCTSRKGSSKGAALCVDSATVTPPRVAQKVRSEPDASTSVSRTGPEEEFTLPSPWLYAVNNNEQVIMDAQVNNKQLIMDAQNDAEQVTLAIDSGCTRVHICPLTFAEDWPLQSSPPIRMLAATGDTVKHYGKRELWLKVDGALLQMQCEVADVTRTLLSADKLLEEGFVITFSPTGSYMKRDDVVVPLQRDHGLFVFHATVVSPKELLEQQKPNIKTQCLPVEQEVEEQHRTEREFDEFPEIPSVAPAVPREIEEPLLPARAEQLRHALVHLPHCAWCRECLQARGRDDAHLARPPEQ